MKLLKLLTATLFLSSFASAVPVSYFAVMNGPNENPPVASPGTGLAKVVIDTTANTLTVEASFQNLLSNTTVAHIHCCVAPPGNVGVAIHPGTFPGFPAGVMSGFYPVTNFDLTQSTNFTPGFLAANGGTAAGAKAGLAAGLASGQAYFNIHTSQFPGGEIRGFFAPVPEPSTIVLAGAGLLALGMIRRRRRT